MNEVDWIILSILGLSVLIGLWRGLIAELLSLVIWVAAFWVASVFGPTVAAQFEHVITVPMGRIGLGYALCFIAVLLVGAVVRMVTRKLLWSTGLTGIDRLFGMLFGFVRGALLVSVLVFLVGLTMATREPWWQQSTLLPQFQGLAAWLGQNIPASVRDFHPTQALDKIHPSAVLDHLPKMSTMTDMMTPLTGGASAPAPARTTPAPTTPGPTTPAPATGSSVGARPGHP